MDNPVILRSRDCNGSGLARVHRGGSAGAGFLFVFEWRELDGDG